MVVLGPSTTIWLRKMIVHHIPGGRAPLESSLGATSPYAGVTIAILGDYFRMGYMYRYLHVGTCIYVVTGWPESLVELGS